MQDIISFVLGKLFRYRLSVCTQNLSRSFPDYTYREIHICTAKFYKNLGRIVWETLFPSRAKLVIHQSAQNKIRELNNRRRPTILLLGHYGNWEVLNKLPQFTAAPVQALYKPLRNTLADYLVRSRRTRYGVQLLKSGQALRTLLKDKNNNSVILFIADQYPGNDNGIAVNFLNQKTHMFSGAEQLAKRLGASVEYIELSSQPNHTWELNILGICDNAAETTDGYITRTYTSMLEASIHKSPSLWLWSHRRWK